MIYRCELCNGRITKKGKGIRPSKKISFVPLDKAVKHICINCIESIVAMVNSSNKETPAEKPEKTEKPEPSE